MKKLWDESRSLADNCRKRLPKLTREYFAAGRAALHPGSSWEEIHHFRLQTKRFRYTLELFRAAYGPALEDRIETMKKLQQILGQINDLITAAGLLESREDLSQFRARLIARAGQKREKLYAFWSTNFDSDGAEQRWVAYLKNYVRSV